MTVPDIVDEPHDRRLDGDTVVSIIIPCFNEEAVLPALFERLTAAAAEWPVDYEVVLVDDGSQDETWQWIAECHRRDPRWKSIRLARNFGHQTALRAGLNACRGDLVAVLDADLQDPPETLARFFEKWAEGFDVVYGVRRDRKEGMFMRSAYFWFYRLLSLLADQEIPLDAGDFCVMDHRVVELLRRMPERKPFVRGLRSWVGFRQVAVPYDRERRAAGETKYSVRRLMGLAADGIFSSSVFPLRVAIWFGGVVSAVAFVCVVLTLLIGFFPEAFARVGIERVEGTVSVLVAILFLGGIQLLFLGVLGEYIGRIYDNAKGRPLCTIYETLGLPPALTERELIDQPSAEHVDQSPMADDVGV